MRAIEKYLKNLTEPLINISPSPDLGIVVTIPAFNESETIKSIESLLNCKPAKAAVEVLVNVNFSEKASESSKLFNEKAFEVLSHYAKQVSTAAFRVHVLYFPNQPVKVAGVGWARKQVMDEAFRRLLEVGNEDGLITGYDADSDCKSNYFEALEEFFTQNKKATACSIQFEHPTAGTKYSEAIYKAIALYELHLRYFINAQKWMGTPYAFQTVGSSFAVRAKHYAAVNGMSPKKAGEDFYFLQKLMALGHFHQLNTTTVFPSSRISNRVGFGTGPSVGEISQTGTKLTYNFKSFVEIKKMLDQLEALYEERLSINDLQLDELMIQYLEQQKVHQVLINLRRNNKTYEKFKMAFMQWFGGFQILKMLNVLRTTERFKDLDVISQVHELGISHEKNDLFELLEILRGIDAKT